MTEGQDPARLLNAREVAQLLGVNPKWVYRAVEREDLPYVRVGRFLRFRATEIEAYLDRSSHGAT